MLVKLFWVQDVAGIGQSTPMPMSRQPKSIRSKNAKRAHGKLSRRVECDDGKNDRVGSQWQELWRPEMAQPSASGWAPAPIRRLQDATTWRVMDWCLCSRRCWRVLSRSPCQVWPMGERLGRAGMALPMWWSSGGEAEPHLMISPVRHQGSDQALTVTVDAEHGCAGGAAVSFSASKACG